MSTDFRALCAELTATLAERIDDKGDAGSYYVHAAHLLTRARTALADEPAVPQGREPAAVIGQPRPTEDDVEDAAQCIYEAMRFERVETTPAWSELGNSLAQDTARKAVRAALARWGNHVPAPPADGEVAELVAWLRETGDTIQPSHLAEHQRYKRAAELLQRQALVPVAVSERMPESKDCDADGMCWWWSNVDGSWYLRRPSHPIVVCSADLLQIWLPAHALPVPEVGE